MVEMVVCTILLSVVGLILAPAIQSVNRQRKSQRFETLTAIELQNLIERLQVTPATPPDQTTLEPWYRQRFPRAELTVTAQPEAQTDLIRVHLQITRPDFGDYVEQTRTLVCWIDESGAQAERGTP